MAEFERKLRFLRERYRAVQHDSHVPFMAHLLATRRLLETWAAGEPLCDAGMFHSIYGTEYFEPGTAALPERGEVQALIGSEAERIAWLWCTVRRATIEPSPPSAVHRKSGQRLQLADGEVADLATLWIADTVEQIDRMAPDERAFGDGVGRLSHLALPGAQRAFLALEH